MSISTIKLTVKHYKLDILVTILFILSVPYLCSLGIKSIGLDYKALNSWFEADTFRIVENMTSRASDHYRTKVHPIFSITTFPIVEVFIKLGLNPSEAVNILLCIVATIWSLLLYSLFRILGRHRLDSVLFTLLAGVSSSSLFWNTVPETFSFGSVSILIALLIAALGENKKLPYFAYIVASAASLSMTITNWMVGIAVAYMSTEQDKLKRTFRMSVDAFALITLIWAAQHILFPSAGFFLNPFEERRYIAMDTSGTIIDKITVFFIHSVVMPSIQVIGDASLSIQTSDMGSSGLYGIIASIMWVVLFTYCLFNLFRNPAFKKLKIVILFTLAGQFSLHMLYGNETFLYSLHWVPILVLIIALGAPVNRRAMILPFVCVLVAITALNNLTQLDSATNKLHNMEASSERNALLQAKQLFPEGIWPREEGHVLLSSPGAKLKHKGYHEPGGSFSPGFASLGAVLLGLDENLDLQYDSNSLPLNSIEQSLDLDAESIINETPYYQSKWSVISHANWRLEYNHTGDSNITPAIQLASSGPAGAAIETIEVLDENQILINSRYEIDITPAPKKIIIGNELTPLNFKSPSAEVQGYGDFEKGFGRALVVFDKGSNYQLDIRDLSTDSAGYSKTFKNSFKIESPNQQFNDSIHAQSFHLKSGFVGEETRPGDPANYPINWQRDGAYFIVALARAGEQTLAKRLVKPFAEDDFFGGFGAEADAPGLAIWAILETADRENSKEYYKWAWPHVQRKANLIIEMLSTTSVMHKSFTGKLIPSQREKPYSELTLVANPAKDGLIQGKMDHHFPIFYVNAVSYLGLIEAAKLADELGFKEKSQHYTQSANRLSEALKTNLTDPAIGSNPRTLISGIWPSKLIAPNNPEYRRLLEENWKSTRDSNGSYVSKPIWTYFYVAESHQWLLMNDRDRVWKTLEWFWNNQTSPGLYTWWEGEGEENSFGLWNQSRGWTKPKHVTPHYWTASEFFLLQFDMIAYEKSVAGKSAIVLGMGFPQSWFDQNFSFKGLSMREGKLDLIWNGNKLAIYWKGQKAPPEFQLSRHLQNISMEIFTQ